MEGAARLLSLATEVEIFLFALAFFVGVLTLSIAATRFIVAAVLSHTFPAWKSWLEWLFEWITRRLR